jgi:cob(I)alamin adenosyltransferase
MVRLTRIYTRGGDKGETSLGDGSRAPKHALRVAAYGTVDEANAAIGIARLHVDTEADAMLGRISAVSRMICSISAPICARPKAAGAALAHSEF